ncbi:MAG: RHS repeat-associated core domain-containing protein [Desulfobacter sp.]
MNPSDCKENANQQFVSNPINIFSGNNIETETDLLFSSPFEDDLNFKRFYNSKNKNNSAIGFGWTHGFDFILTPFFQMSTKLIRIVDGSGKGYYFQDINDDGVFNGTYQGYGEIITGITGNYEWVRENGEIYTFNQSNGKLQSISDKNGNEQTLAYDAQGRLDTVTDNASGRSLSFQYEANGRIQSISGPVNSVTYAYDTFGNLILVIYSDDGNGSGASGFEYRYEDPNDPNNMTAKYDLAGNLISTWAYDEQDRAVENVNREGKGVVINYGDPANVVVTDVYGISNTFEITEIEGRKKITAKTGASGCSACSEGIVRTEFDPATGFPTEREFANGRIDKYQDYDDRGNPGKRIIASGTAWENTIITTWHPTLEAPLTRTQKSLLADDSAPDRERVVIWDYDDPSAPGNTDLPNENPTVRIYRTILRGFTLNELGDVAAFEQVATYAYNSKGQVVSVDGPLDGTLDTITFSYDAGTGDLVSVTRPLAGAMTFTHDAAGNIITATDENQIQTVFTYDGRNRQTSAAAENASVTSTFTAAGEPAAQTDRTGRTQTLAYDTKGFLQRITNPSGNYLFYTYDENGNPVESSIFSAGGVKTLFKGYDYGDPVADPDLSPGMPAKALAMNQDDTATLETLFAYEHGNLIRITDPMGAVRSFAYDPLNRPVIEREQQDSDTTAEILYTHDSNGNLVRVTDPEGLVTSYTYDDANRLVKTISPDTGTTSYQYDAASNLVSKQTGDGIRVTYTYDALGRRTGIQYPDPGENVVFFYDQGINGKGRLTGISHTGDVYAFSYDAMGNLVTVIRTTDQAAFTTTYGYDASGRLMSMTCPDGRTVAYERDADGNVAKVLTAKDGTTLVLADNMAYKPFGPLAAMTLGAGRGISTEFDLNYRHLSRTVPGILERSLSYDPGGRIISIADQLDSTRNQNFGYDKAGRLTSATGPYGTLGFTYDRTGNRLTRTLDDAALTYTYTQGTNRLAQISGTGSQTDLVYDGAGKPLSKGDMNFAYTQAGRLATVSGSGNEIAAYLYNSLGQRTRKTVDGKTTLFHYDLFGNLIGESSPDGTFSMAYVYTDSTRLAALAMESTTQQDVAYYINDHLGTPVKMIDDDGRVVWDGVSLPFGRVSESLGEAQNHFRFPGQYYDEEAGLHYNWHRYYDPVTGRYISPDPIGLAGGINPFLYAEANPINLIDPEGLSPDLLLSSDPTAYYEIRADEIGADIYTSEGANCTGSYIQQEAFTQLNSMMMWYGFWYSLPNTASKFAVSDFAQVSNRISQKQLRHIAGRKEYRGGGFLNSVDDAQSVLNAFQTGSTKIIGKSKQGFPIVRYNGVTGTNVNVSAGYSNQATNVFMIKGTKSPSVVPMNPKWRP